MRVALDRAWLRGESARAKPGLADKLTALLAVAMLAAAAAGVSMESAPDADRMSTAAGDAKQPLAITGQEVREVVVSGYLAQPYYYRSNVRMQRNDRTDIELKRMGWDGDMLYPPIDGGVRSVHWSGSTGFMIDFLHNKAIARLGKGAHGSRKGARPIETVETAGTLRGEPAPAKLKLTDLFERFEFTHGHNVLLLNGMMRLGAITPRIRPYFGAGAGFALPHVEVWFADEKRENRTNEYQFAGPAAQFVAGLELRTGRIAYYFEYKFSWAWISGALTGDESWKNYNMPGDLLRQFLRWWRGQQPEFGRFSTRLFAHQGVIGVGYVFPAKATASAN